MKNIDTVIAAIQFIEANLADEKIDLDYVAEAVHYSKYHLHRIFTETVGLSIHDYTLRRQLTEAAKLLVFSRKPILEIANTSGYESQQAFSGAFKAMYKVSPMQFRKNEVFYPLQLAFVLGTQRDMLGAKEDGMARQTRYAKETDITAWMELTHLAIDGFPYLEDEQHIESLKRYIAQKGAFIMLEGELLIGSLMLGYDTGSIDFLAVHPLYRKQEVSKELLDVALHELLEKKEVSITTYREGDKADTGYRKALQALGFAEAELLTEFGYPTQRMVLSKEEKDA